MPLQHAFLVLIPGFDLKPSGVPYVLDNVVLRTRVPGMQLWATIIPQWCLDIELCIQICKGCIKTWRPMIATEFLSRNPLTFILFGSHINQMEAKLLVNELRTQAWNARCRVPILMLSFTRSVFWASYLFACFLTYNTSNSTSGLLHACTC